MIKMMIEILKAQFGTTLIVSSTFVILAGWVEYDLSKDPVRCPILAKKILLNLLN